MGKNTKLPKAIEVASVKGKHALKETRIRQSLVWLSFTTFSQETDRANSLMPTCMWHFFQVACMVRQKSLVNMIVVIQCKTFQTS